MFLGRRDRIIRSLIKTRLLVFARDGGVFDGLLLSADRRVLEFGDVHARNDGISTPAPGELYIERDRLAYMQRVPAEQPPVG